jgi:hypothetical protein
MAVGTPTTNSGSSTTPSTAVPTGVAIGDIVVLACELDSATITFTGKWPTGFTQLVGVAGTKDGAQFGIAWKRLTAADTGSYTLTALSASIEWAITAIPLTGRHATNAPVISANSLDNTGSVSPLTVTANSVTATAGDDLLFISIPDVVVSGAGNGHGTWAAPFTTGEIVDLESTGGWCNIGVAKAENVAAGATGTKTVTFTLTSSSAGSGSWLLAVPAAAAGGTNATVTAVPALSAGSAPVGAFSAGANVAAVKALSAGSAPAAFVGAGGATNVTAVPALSAGSAPAAPVAGGVTVTGVQALSAGSAPPANQTISFVVAAPASVSLGSAPAAVVNSGGANVTVTAVPASSARSTVAAVVAAGVGVTGVTASSVGSAPASSLTQGAAVAAAPAVSAGQTPRPAVTPAPTGANAAGNLASTFAEGAS